MNPYRNEYQLQIDRALSCRIRESWPLYPMSEWRHFKIDKDYWESLVPEKRPLRFEYVYDKSFLRGVTENSILSLLRERFPCVFYIMQVYPGKIYPCGGFFTNPINSKDIDLFFVDCSEALAEEIVETFAINFRNTYRRAQNYRTQDMFCSRFEGVTNFNVTDKNYPSDIKVSYQFIHRIYPTLNHVLGGFDLSCSMIAHDGHQIVATEQGAWAFVNQCVVIDISRRSLSFSNRVRKYQLRGFDIIFPGSYHQNSLALIDKKEENFLDFVEELKALLEKYSMGIKNNLRAGASHMLALPERFYNDYEHGSKVLLEDAPFIYEKIPKIVSGFQVRYKDSKNKEVKENYKKRGVLCFFSKYIPRSVKIDLNDYETSNNYTGDIQSNYYAVKRNHLERVGILVYFEHDEMKTLEKLFEERLQDRNVHRHEVYEPNAEILNQVFRLMETKVKINWMTQDPQRQWSSTVNPSVIKASEFYGSWNGYHAIIQPEVYYLLLMMMRRPDCVWSLINKDVLKMIIVRIPL